MLYAYYNTEATILKTQTIAQIEIKVKLFKAWKEKTYNSAGEAAITSKQRGKQLIGLEEMW